MSDSRGQCDVCGKEARQFCSACKLVFYCSRDCQKKSWKSHKLQCRPFTIEKNNIYGRYVAASREIKAGEIILKEEPLAVGPKQCTHPVCLGCHKRLKEIKIYCKRCNYPLCSTNCENSKYHKDECAVLSKMSSPVRIREVSRPHPAYECITPLRCLLLKKSDAKKWEAILSLQSHAKEIQETSLYKVNKSNIVDFIREFLHYPEIEGEVIHHICGCLNTNSFEVLQNEHKIRGIYNVASMFAHSCTPNTKHAFDSDNNIIFRATQNIPKGGIIFTTYTHTLWDTLSRRSHLKMAKFFLCECTRCQDPTELETNFGTLICSKCEGNIRSSDPLQEEADWLCDRCGHKLLARQIKFGNDMLNKELRGGLERSAKSLENFIESYKGALHPHHRFMMEAKYALVKHYGNSKSCRYRDLTQKELENKVDWSRELLEIADIIDPGKSLLRGNVLYELQAGLVASSKCLLANEIITKKKAEEYMTEAVRYLQEATEILKQEPEYENDGFELKLKWLSDELEL